MTVIGRKPRINVNVGKSILFSLLQLFQMCTVLRHRLGNQPAQLLFPFQDLSRCGNFFPSGNQILQNPFCGSVAEMLCVAEVIMTEYIGRIRLKIMYFHIGTFE